MIPIHYLLFISKSTQIFEVKHKREKFKKREDELKCPLCLDFFKSLVRMTNCGHNYCQECLTGITEFLWLCPECRTEQQQRPEHLARNFFLERTVENFIASRKNLCGAHNLPKKLRKYFYQFNQQVR